MAFSLHRILPKNAALGLALAALVGCASVAASPETVVRQRAQENWKAMMKKDFDSTYQLTPPSYRAATPITLYKKGFGDAIEWTAAEVASVKCETEDKCLAHMKVEAKSLHPLNRRAPPLVNYFDETWIREGGQWWLFPTQ